MNVSCLCGIGVTALFKYLNQTSKVEIVEVMLFRNALNLVFVWFLLLKPLKINPLARQAKTSEGKDYSWWVYLRTLVGQTSFVLTFLVVLMIPLFMVQVIVRLSPLWVSCLGFCVNQEKVKWFELVAIAFCLLGVSIIAAGKAGESDGAD